MMKYLLKKKNWQERDKQQKCVLELVFTCIIGINEFH